MILEYKNDEKSARFFNIKQLAKEEFNMSDRLIAKLKNKKKIYLNGIPVKVTTTLNPKDLVTFDLNYEEESENIIPTKMDLDIIYEDEAFLVINKPPFTPVHPSENHFTDSLSNGVKYYFNKINLNKKIRPVNRLDKDTSGIVIFAKNEYIQEKFIKQMENGNFNKKYLAILTGILNEKEGFISAPIARKNDSIIEREINFEKGQSLITHFKLLKTLPTQNSLVEFDLLTGRTHQIRVHSKYIGHPILGDSLYGTTSNLIARQALHAYKITISHPITKKKITLVAKLPEDIKQIL